MIPEFMFALIIIMALFFSGFTIFQLVFLKLSLMERVVLSYPLGLSIYVLSGLIMLILGIPYRVESIAVFYVLLYALLIVISKKYKLSAKKLPLKIYLIVAIVVAAFAAISCSGLISVGISNDSIYYYSLYPQTIAVDGFYDLSYDVFLTDVGQSVAVINTLPFFFGFNQSFGIQLFSMINFIAFFMYFCNIRIKNKKALGVLFVLLISSTPFLVMSKWILANAYFMEFMFIIFGVSTIYHQNKNKELLYIIFVLTAVLSMMRMEGGIMAGLLIMYISLYDIKNKYLALFYVLPSIILIIPYYLVIYIKFRVNPTYSFLDVKNAMIQVLFLLCIGIYVLLIRNRFLLKLQGKNLPLVIISGLWFVNLVLFAYDHVKYIKNINAFLNNIFQGNGWGYFGFMVLLILMVIPVKNEFEISSAFCASFVLMCIAVLFARNGALRIGTGDSGNRVLLQIVPFVIYSLAVVVYDYFNESSLTQ